MKNILYLLFLILIPINVLADQIIYLNQADTDQRQIPIFLVEPDGITPKTGFTPGAAEMRVCVPDGTCANFAGSWDELENGNYFYEAAAGEIDDAGPVTGTIIDAAEIRTYAFSFQVIPAVTVQNIVDGVLDEPIAGHNTAGTVGEVFNDLTAYMVATTVALIADGIWDEILSGHVGAGSTGAALTNILDDTGTSGVVLANGSITSAKFAAGAIDAAAIATDAIGNAEIANNAISAAKIATDAIGADEFAQGAADKIWATASRTLTGTQTFNLTGNITGNLTGSVGSVTGAVGSVTGSVGGNVTGTVGGLTTAGMAEFFTVDTGETYATSVAGSVVQEIADNSSGGSCPTAQQITDAVLDELIAGHLGAGSVGAAINACSAGGGGESTYQLW